MNGILNSVHLSVFLLQKNGNSKKGNFFDHPDDMNLTQFDGIDLDSFFNLTEPEVVVLRVRPNLTFKTN